jgi:hypothetical protein
MRMARAALPQGASGGPRCPYAGERLRAWHAPSRSCSDVRHTRRPAAYAARRAPLPASVFSRARGVRGSGGGVRVRPATGSRGRGAAPLVSPLASLLPALQRLLLCWSHPCRPRHRTAGRGPGAGGPRPGATGNFKLKSLRTVQMIDIPSLLSTRTPSKDRTLNRSESRALAP